MSYTIWSLLGHNDNDVDKSTCYSNEDKDENCDLNEENKIFFKCKSLILRSKRFKSKSCFSFIIV